MNRIDKLLKKCIVWLLQVLQIEMINECIQNWIQFIKFGLVGVTNSIVGYVINISVIFLLRPYSVSWDYFFGNVVSFIISVLWSFFLNNRFVFTKREDEVRNLWVVLFKTYASYAFTGLVLNNVLSYIWIELIGISKMISPIINMAVGLPVNYILNKFWAYNNIGEKSKRS